MECCKGLYVALDDIKISKWGPTLSEDFLQVLRDAVRNKRDGCVWSFVTRTREVGFFFFKDQWDCFFASVCNSLNREKAVHIRLVDVNTWQNLRCHRKALFWWKRRSVYRTRKQLFNSFITSHHNATCLPRFRFFFLHWGYLRMSLRVGWEL